MKAIKLILLLLIAAGFINFIKAEHQFHIAKILPFADGQPVSAEYAIGGIILLIILFWGITRLNRRDDQDK